jgi:ribosomal protein S18 acetylase RimI-like enzyme
MSTGQPEARPIARTAGLADLPQLVALMVEFYAESAHALPADKARQAFAALLERADLGSVHLVEADGQAAGYAVLTVGYSMEYGGLRGFVDDLFVRPSMRQRGLATSLLDGIRREAERRSVCALLVETSTGNEPAQRLYRRAGFEDLGHPFLSQALLPPLHIEEPA